MTPRPWPRRARVSAHPLILTSTRPSARPGAADAAPRRDFELLAARLQAPISLPGPRVRGVAVAERRVRLDLSQAVRGCRQRPAAYVSLSERVGIPLSVIDPATPHIMITHLLTSRSKRALTATTGALRRPAKVLAFSRAQERYLRTEVGLDAGRAQFISDKVDQLFFSPDGATEGDYVLSVGREQRDYATLVAALQSLGIPGVIVPGSTWSHRSLQLAGSSDQITIRSGISYQELRALYQRARLVVVPVHAGIDYAAGVNGVLEAMACARPVVCSDTPGLSGYVRDRVDGRLVGAGDSAALARVVAELWDDRTQRERLGAAARQTVERERTLEHFVDAVAGMVAQVA